MDAETVAPEPDLSTKAAHRCTVRFVFMAYNRAPVRAIYKEVVGVAVGPLRSWGECAYTSLRMLVFIDESGDPGFKVDQGASRFFTIALVIFGDREDATACDQRIRLLHKELDWFSECHFKKNPDYVREAFVRAIAPYNFFYYGVVIDKKQQHHLVQHFPTKDSFYQYVCGLVLESAKDKLQDATVIVDVSGNREFGVQLARYLRNKINIGPARRISKLKMQRSQTNNLIQLADYVAGVLNRAVQRKKHGADYRRLISHREMDVQIWPPFTD